MDDWLRHSRDMLILIEWRKKISVQLWHASSNMQIHKFTVCKGCSISLQPKVEADVLYNCNLARVQLWLDYIVTVLIERNIKSQIIFYLLDIAMIIKRKWKKKTSFWSMNIQAKHTVNIGLSSRYTVHMTNLLDKTANARVKGHLEPTHLKSSSLFTFSSKR